MTFTVSGGAPTAELLDVWSQFLVDHHGDYLAFRSGSASTSDLVYVLMFGDSGSIEETQSGYSIDTVQVVTLANMPSSVGLNLTQHSFTASGEVLNPDSICVWSNVGVAPRLQSAELVREGVPVYVFSLCFFAAVGAVCCGLSGLFKHLH